MRIPPAHFPPGKVLSCRVFDPGKDALGKEARSSGWGVWMDFSKAPSSASKQSKRSILAARSRARGTREDGKDGPAKPAAVAKGGLFCIDPEDVWGMFSQPTMPRVVRANVRDNGAGAPCWQEKSRTRFIATFLVVAAWTAERAGLYRVSIP